MNKDKICRRCKTTIPNYTGLRIPDNVTLCYGCSRFLFNLAKDSKLTYKEYRVFEKEYQERQDIRHNYLKMLKKQVISNKGDKVDYDTMITEIKNIIVVENKFTTERFKKERHTINDKDYTIMAEHFLKGTKPDANINFRVNSFDKIYEKLEKVKM